MIKTINYYEKFGSWRKIFYICEMNIKMFKKNHMKKDPILEHLELELSKILSKAAQLNNKEKQLRQSIEYYIKYKNDNLSDIPGLNMIKESCTDYPMSAKTDKKILYLLKKIGHAVKISRLSDAIKDIEGIIKGEKSTASMNYMLNRLIKNNELVGVIFGNSKQHMFYGLQWWKSESSIESPFIGNHSPKEEDFGNMLEENRKKFKWIEKKSISSLLEHSKTISA